MVYRTLKKKIMTNLNQTYYWCCPDCGELFYRNVYCQSNLGHFCKNSNFSGQTIVNSPITQNYEQKYFNDGEGI